MAVKACLYTFVLRKRVRGKSNNKKIFFKIKMFIENYNFSKMTYNLNLEKITHNIKKFDNNIKFNISVSTLYTY